MTEKPRDPRMDHRHRYTTRASLLARLADGDDQLAWEEFHLQYADLIRRVAVRRGLQAADCEDVVQNVLVKMTGALPGFRYDPARGSFRGYLKTIVLREIIDRFRQKKGPKAVSLADDGPTGASVPPELDAIWEEEWQTHHVELAMRRIQVEFGERDRLAFEQYAVQGLGVEETAAVTGLTVNQVYKAKSRILKRLSELVAEQVAEEIEPTESGDT